MGSPSYHGENTLPHINKVNTAPYDVSNNYLIPICRFTVNASRETTAIVQLQHGPIWVSLRKSNLFWDGEKVGFVHGGDGDIYSYTQNIPANTEDSIIYYDAAEGHMQIDDYFDDDANKSIIIGRITTNGQGRCTRLLDYTTMRPSSELYTDTIYAAI
jgi:hypothetical protein